MPIEKYHQQKIALGCTTTLVLVTDMPQSQVDIVFAKLWLQIFKFEKRFSRFLKYSELSLFNRDAGKQIKISPEFEDILIKAKQMAKVTGDIYNPFVLPSLHRVGYRDSFIDEYKDDSIDYSHRFVVSADSLVVGDGYAEIPANSAFDLGGIGKGYLADLLSNSEDLKNMAGYWFSLGGDVIGSGVDSTGTAWEVHTQNAALPEKLIDYTYVSDGNTFALATSGTITRKGVNSKNGKWHHIIDPVTLKPSDSDVVLATVVAASACTADVMAKTAVIVGSKKGERFLSKHSIHAYILQLKTGEVTVVGDFADKPKKYSKTKSKVAVQ